MAAYKAETIGGLSMAMQSAAKEASVLLSDGKVAVIEVKEGERGRTALQNSKIHAMLGDIARQVELNGRKLDAHIWKRLTVAEWLKESGERPLIIQDLSGEVLVLWEKTSKMTAKQMASYTEWLYAFGADNDVVWSEKQQ